MLQTEVTGAERCVGCARAGKEVIGSVEPSHCEWAELNALHTEDVPVLLHSHTTLY